ncbi:MAG: adenylate/guanylate cyclase domain-containing protein [Gammaproteobacteria bacterium]|jgi:class 3 adenylate cyclase
MIEERELTILFADVCGSTALYELLGDLKAQDTITRCLGIMTEVTRECGGRVIKTIGDEVMATFPAPDAAGAAAAIMQQRVSAEVSVEQMVLRLRIGFHLGTVLLDKGDVFGDAVNVAARLASQAKPGEVLTSADTVDGMTDEWKSATRHVDRNPVRGRRESTVLHELLWERDDVTRRATTLRGHLRSRRLRLVLTFRDCQIEVTEERPSATLGRSEQSDLVVRHSLISRLHARVEYRRGKFVLIDQSINGTYLVDEHGEESFLRREELPLRGAGVIALGRSLELESPEAVRFACLD